MGDTTTPEIFIIDIRENRQREESQLNMAGRRNQSMRGDCEGEQERSLQPRTSRGVWTGDQETRVARKAVFCKDQAGGSEVEAQPWEGGV